MPIVPAKSPWPSEGAPDLLSLATSVLAREASRIAVPSSGVPASLPGLAAVSPAVPAVPGAETVLPGQPAAGTPFPSPNVDVLRRQAHELIESLLVTFSQTTGEKGAPHQDQVPLLRCAAPVQAGGHGSASMGVANDEDTPSDVSLYCTNFVADSGHEIPSLRVTVSPRRVTIPPRGQAAFAIKIAVSQQTPAGTYSGLIQATGSQYVKAVLLVEVL
jgi:hypothetical protein